MPVITGIRRDTHPPHGCPPSGRRHAPLTRRGWGLRDERRGLVCKYRRRPAAWDGAHAHCAHSGARVLAQCAGLLQQWGGERRGGVEHVNEGRLLLRDWSRRRKRRDRICKKTSRRRARGRGRAARLRSEGAHRLGVVRMQIPPALGRGGVARMQIYQLPFPSSRPDVLPNIALAPPRQ